MPFPKAGQYTVEFDDSHHVLNVFIDPKKEFKVDKDSEYVIYFGAGVHQENTSYHDTVI